MEVRNFADGLSAWIDKSGVSLDVVADTHAILVRPALMRLELAAAVI